VIRTLIADRMALIRAGLVACISRERDIEVVAELDRREPVLPTVSSLRPDVAVIDNDIAGHDGFAVIHALHSITPSCHTLIMATRPHPGDLRKAVAAHATGFKVIVATMASRVGFDTPKNALNVLILANTAAADYVVDFTGTPLGCDGCYANPTYFTGDQIHPNLFSRQTIEAPAFQLGVTTIN